MENTLNIVESNFESTSVKNLNIIDLNPKNEDRLKLPSLPISKSLTHLDISKNKESENKSKSFDSNLQNLNSSKRVCNESFINLNDYIEDDDHDSFESTDESDTDFAEEDNDFGSVKKEKFHSNEIVWGKRTLVPWFPCIIVDPNDLSKEMKDVLKKLGSPLPSREKLEQPESKHIPTNKIENIYLVLFLNKKKNWVHLPESKLRPFCKENDDLFFSKAKFFSQYYRKHLNKSYKKAKKIIEKTNDSKSDSNSTNNSHGILKYVLSHMLRHHHTTK